MTKETHSEVTAQYNFYQFRDSDLAGCTKFQQKHGRYTGC